MAQEREKKQTRTAGDSESSAARLVSVGHSNHEWPAFVALIHRVGVTALADVRSSPYSGRYPCFNREPLAGGLREQGSVPTAV